MNQIFLAKSGSKRAKKITYIVQHGIAGSLTKNYFKNMSKDKPKFALHVTKEAKNNTFENCDIQGAKIEGQGTKMIKSRIFQEYIKKRPKTFCLIVIGIVPVLIGLAIEYGFLK